MSIILFTVAKALLEVTVKDSSLKILTEDNSKWIMFGKKDSHLLRAKLFKIFSNAKLDQETKFMVFFFFSIIKNRNRVLSSFDELSAEVMSIPSVSSAKTFIKDYLVQYTSQETSTKFAVVHLPTTMPGLDVMLNSLILEDNPDNFKNNIISKQTFAQIHINSELQATNKSAQMVFWNSVVKNSRNEAREKKSVTEELKFNENYYNTSAADKYLLVDINFKEVSPKDAVNGYNEKEVLDWFSHLKSEQAKMINLKSSKKAASPPPAISTSLKSSSSRPPPSA